jgi:hypothetical protein
MQNNNFIKPVQNRAEKRRAEKILKMKGASKENINEVISLMNGFGDMKNLPKYKECLLEGDRVKLDVEKIKAHKSWNTYNPNYRQFVEDNADRIFTVKYDDKHKDKPNMVTFAEDDSKENWLWYDGHLLVEDKNGKFREMYTMLDEDSKVIEEVIE